jgi:hypothetical protein
MSTEYVTFENGAYRLTGTRVSLDSLVYAYHRGASSHVASLKPLRVAEQKPTVVHSGFKRPQSVPSASADGVKKSLEMRP